MISKSLFDNTETAFALKSDSELERAYFLFKMISMEPLVKIGAAVTKFALHARLPVEGLVRSTVFDHFCGGINEQDCMPTVEALKSAGVYSVLDFSVEGKDTQAQFDATMEKVIFLTRFAKDNRSMPFSVFKPTGLGRFEIWRKKSADEKLSDREEAEWEAIVNRYDQICSVASECSISLLIDAEESWMQAAADKLCEQMMKKYNRDKVVVYNTLQCYRSDRYEYLVACHERAVENGYKLGFKVVRGAYMEKERERAAEKGYESPICENKLATDTLYDKAISYILAHLDTVHLFLGTHNENSCYKALLHMQEHQLPNNEARIWFGQLYGMSDHISYNLAALGYNVCKYIPFGPVKDVMPYLIRRAEENTSVAGQTSRELGLLQKEKKRRGLK
ncbi:proline dehydrogenase family protein [Altibacter sp. HG106]|uniref:proline dehydrogenase family protein n=1 Tax=Altibacter sp. HG106 TaxID=3023937 RepID=UPI002350B2CE|nr:proline dehydrogenase family protein [Altibacter sp. HG106]MDC7993615.1 proline dehydrogenase family protein [Altibacter sp. HG106]